MLQKIVDSGILVLLWAVQIPLHAMRDDLLWTALASFFTGAMLMRWVDIRTFTHALREVVKDKQ